MCELVDKILKYAQTPSNFNLEEIENIVNTNPILINQPNQTGLALLESIVRFSCSTNAISILLKFGAEVPI